MDDSYIVTMLISVSILITLLLFFITLFVLVNKNKHRGLYLEKKELEHQFEKELLTTRLEVQEQSLNIISHEIHDNICQILGRVKNNLYAIEYNVNIEDSGNLLHEATTLVGQSIDDLRTISHVLNPEYIRRIGLEDSIKKELEHLKSFYKLNSKLELSGDTLDIPQEKGIILFRIIQEALGNIVKHAKATHVHLRIEYSDSSIIMTIIDNGIGFDIDTIKSKNKGIGLINMEQRVSLIDGSISIKSNINKGTILSIKINC